MDSQRQAIDGFLAFLLRQVTDELLAFPLSLALKKSQSFALTLGADEFLIFPLIMLHLIYLQLVRLFHFQILTE